MKKLLITYLVIVAMFLSSLIAEDRISDDINNYAVSLGKQSLYGSLLYTILNESSIQGKKTDLKKLIDSYETDLPMKKFVRDFTFNQNERKLLTQDIKTIEQKLKINTKKFNNIEEVEDAFSSSFGVALDTVSVLTTSYGLYQNIDTFFDKNATSWQKKEAAAVGVNNIYGLVQSVFSVLSTLSKNGSGGYIKVLGNSTFSKTIGEFSQKASMRVLGVVTIGTQMESLIYQHFRDKNIEGIKDYIFSKHINEQNRNKEILQNLIELYEDRYYADSNITFADLLSKIENELILHFEYPNTTGKKSISLAEIFRNRAANSSYLENNFQKSSFAELNNMQKSHVLLDALAYFSALQDGEVQSYLSDKVANGNTVADVIFSAFDGSGIYKIYNVEDIKNRLFPYREEGISAYAYYKAIFSMLFESSIATDRLERQARIGKLIADNILKNTRVDSEPKIKIIFKVPQTVTINNYIISAHKGDDISIQINQSGNALAEYIKDAIASSSPIKLWFEDTKTHERDFVTVSLDTTQNIDGFYTFSFKAPSDSFMPLRFTYFDDEHRGDIGFELGNDVKFITDNSINSSNSNIVRNSVDFNSLDKSIIIEFDGGLIDNKYKARYLLRFKSNHELKYIRLNLDKDKECQDKQDEEDKSTNQTNLCNPDAIDILNGDWSVNDDILTIDFYDEGEHEVKLKEGKLEENMQLLGSDIVEIDKASELSLDKFAGKTVVFFSETGKYSYWTFGLNGILYIKNDKNEFTTANWSLKEKTDGKYIDITSEGKSILRIYNDSIMVGDLVDMHGYRGVFMGIKNNNQTDLDNNTYIYLKSENYQDGTVVKTQFTKEWTFSEDISNFDINVVSNSYANSIDSNSFTKNGNKLSVTLKPNTTNPTNKLVLKFTKDGNPVKVNGSETFWFLTKTNHAPRLADGQITQLVSATNEPTFLDIKTFDGDGDNVTLSIEDDAGGYVGFSKDNPNRIFASFNDGKVYHVIKIGLNDGKEKKIVKLNVLQFNKTSIDSFYSDVDKNAPDYLFDGIAFGTLKGVVWGQPDPNDPTKRVFRPKDDASMAEALAMIINAEKQAGLINLKSSNYYMDVFPKWAMDYYTFARESGAIDKRFDLASYYPTKEEIAKIIVKTLRLDNKLEGMDINATFSDSADFSDASMLHYAKIAKFFGLFMTDDSAKPKEKISRAKLATVILKVESMVIALTMN